MVELEGVELSRCDTGVQVCRGGKLIARRVRAVDCSTAFGVVRIAHVSCFEGCSVKGGGPFGGRPVVVQRHLGPAEGFRVEGEVVTGIDLTEAGAAAVPDPSGVETKNSLNA